jgi:hypothetical protein
MYTLFLSGRMVNLPRLFLQVLAPRPLMSEIDRTSYNKAEKHPVRWGYQARGGSAPSSIIIHTTSNKRPTRFETEARYLLDSPDVSAHFLIGKSGEIVEFLSPARWQAWHAGNTKPDWLNARSIGIEHHVSVGESWTEAQHEACTWLVRSLMSAYGIPPSLVETHRAVALPKGRKRDPEGWGDEAFYAWRATLQASPLHKRYKILGTPVWQQQQCTGPIALYLTPGTIVEVDKTYDEGTAHLATGAGFIRLDASVEAI